MKLQCLLNLYSFYLTLTPFIICHPFLRKSITVFCVAAILSSFTERHSLALLQKLPGKEENILFIMKKVCFIIKYWTKNQSKNSFVLVALLSK